jgi:hypothetical protein
LYGDPVDQNATDSYSLGINSGTLRYNVPTGAFHRFYVNASDIVDVGSGGMIINIGGLFLPSPGGFPSALNYYEDYIFDSPFYGCYTIPSIQFRVARVGRMVTMTQITTVPYGIALTTTTFNSGAYIPPRFCPTINTIFAAHMVLNTNTSEIGTFTINNSGLILITRAGGQNWPSGSTSGWRPNSFAWTV